LGGAAARLSAHQACPTPCAPDPATPPTIEVQPAMLVPTHKLSNLTEKGGLRDAGWNAPGRGEVWGDA
jgi:hypothetical protein